MEHIDDGVDWKKRAHIEQPKYWNEINTRYAVQVYGIKCEIGIDYAIYYNLRWGRREIGNCIPRFYIDFKESVSIEIFGAYIK